MIKVLFKATVSAALIWLLLRNTDTTSVLNQVLDVGWGSFLFAAAVMAALSLPATARWRTILATLSRRIDWWAGWRIVMTGLFFNQVLPSSVGGDAVRMWQARSAGFDLRTAVNSVLIDRVIGLAVVFLITAVSLPRLFEIIGDPRLRWAFIVVVLGGLAGLVGLIVFDRVGEILQRWSLTRALGALSGDFRRVVINAHVGMTVISLSVLIQIVFALVAFLLARSLALPLTAPDCIVLIPPIVLVMAAPVSIAGWGVREGAMVIALGFVGIDSHDALALSVLLGAATVCGALPGGLVWLITGHARPPMKIAAGDRQ
jgi:uncharacterized protein (TIRG00374 family)